MAKSYKDYQEVLGYPPSTYQVSVFDFIVHGQGNAVIKAKAGSGKTSIMIASMKLIDKDKKCLFLAFNKSIKDEISEKLINYKNCTVKTVHGLGYDILCSELDERPEVNEYKYRDYIRQHITELFDNDSFISGNDYNEYVDNIIQLLEFSRLNLAQSKREINSVASHHGLSVSHNEVDIVKKLMEWGKKQLKIIDYTDMVWIPNELSMFSFKNRYDWIFNDEAQDYSIAYVNLFKKCFKRSTRFVSCGDEYQSINQFAGASEKAFQEMINYRNTTVFELPISYRCDKAIIKEANRFVDDIVARPDAGLGLVKYDSSITDIQSNDMVLCRNNAPLLKMYQKLINRGIPCYIKGVENDKENLISIINRFSVGEELGKDFSSDGLFPRMYDDMIAERNRLVACGMNNYDAINSASVQSKYDMIVSLSILAAECDSTSCLLENIEKIYKTNNVGVCLSTIHKAKGLESDNVHIICRSLMPKRSAKTPQEIQQEKNLIYVAITRPRHKLCYLSEKEFPPTKAITDNEDDVSEFDYIESMVCKLYNKKPITISNNIELSDKRLNNDGVVNKLNKKTLNSQKKLSGKIRPKFLDEL